MENIIDTIKIPNVNSPHMKLYNDLHDIILVYDKNKWNFEVKSEIYTLMFLVRNRMLKNKKDLKKFLEAIQADPNVMPEIRPR